MSAPSDSSSSRRHLSGSQRHRLVRPAVLEADGEPKVGLRLVTEWRPRTRRDCDDVPRPCPYVSCQHNLYLDVLEPTGPRSRYKKPGRIQLNFPDIEPDEMPANRSCALDLAEQGGMTLDETGEAMNVTRERVRQIESKALRTLDARARRARRRFETFESHAGFPDEGES